jgi:hypothetical protein
VSDSKKSSLAPLGLHVDGWERDQLLPHPSNASRTLFVRSAKLNGLLISETPGSSRPVPVRCPGELAEAGDAARLGHAREVRGCLETALGDLNPDNSMESERSPIPGAFDVDPRDPCRA